MADSSALKIDTGGKEDFRRLRNSGMAKAAPAEPSSSEETVNIYFEVVSWLYRLGEEGSGPSSVPPPPPPPFPSAGGGGGGGGGRDEGAFLPPRHRPIPLPRPSRRPGRGHGWDLGRTH